MKKRERAPGEKCDCHPSKHVIAQTAWSAFSGYALTYRCNDCQATWKTRTRNANGTGSVF